MTNVYNGDNFYIDIDQQLLLIGINKKKLSPLIFQANFYYYGFNI